MTPASTEAGTPLAQRPAVAATDAVWRNHRDQFFLREARSTSKLMSVIGCVVFAAMVGILVDASYPTWRIVAMVVTYLGFVGGHRLVIRQTRELGRVEHAFIKMNVMAQLFVVGMAGLTGGVHSPFLPGCLIPAIVSLLFFGPQSVSRWIALGNGLFAIVEVRAALGLAESDLEALL